MSNGKIVIYTKRVELIKKVLESILRDTDMNIATASYGVLIDVGNNDILDTTYVLNAVLYELLYEVIDASELGISISGKVYMPKQVFDKWVNTRSPLDLVFMKYNEDDEILELETRVLSITIPIDMGRILGMEKILFTDDIKFIRSNRDYIIEHLRNIRRLLNTISKNMGYMPYEIIRVSPSIIFKKSKHGVELINEYISILAEAGYIVSIGRERNNEKNDISFRQEDINSIRIVISPTPSMKRYIEDGLLGTAPIKAEKLRIVFRY